MYKLLNISW